MSSWERNKMKPGQVKRGFKQFRRVAQSKQGTLRRIRCCSNCEFNAGEEEVDCVNNNVTSFDMGTNPDTGEPCCTFWRLSGTCKEN